MKTIEEQIAVMQHFANGGEVEWHSDDRLAVWMDLRSGHFNWIDNDYRIKEQKKTVTIEKWLCKSNTNEYYIKEGCSLYLEDFRDLKVKLLEAYEVEI